MKAVVAKGWGPAQRLVLGEAEKPTPGKNDVLVQVRAASVNPKDWKLNSRLPQLLTPLASGLLPPVFGDDLAGVIVDKGEKVTGYEIGDAVYGMDMRLRTASLAEYAVIDTRRIAAMPANISFAEAAAVPLAGQTALQGLRKGGAVQGSSVIIIGASGGVGTYAVQIAKRMGCEVTAVCSSRNLELVESLGADHLIDYTAGDYRKSSGQFDVVFDVTSYETPRSCAALLKDDGHFISTMGNGRAVRSTLLARRHKASLVVVESYTRDLQTLADWLENGEIHSVIDSRFDLADAEQAYERSRSGRARGKIVIEISA